MMKQATDSQPEPRRADMHELHLHLLQVVPACKLWFLDDGTRREFYQIGLSANKTGISVYILGIEDKKYLAETYAEDLGKASVTGYCIRFKTLKDINPAILKAAILFGFENTSEKG